MSVWYLLFVTHVRHTCLSHKNLKPKLIRKVQKLWRTQNMDLILNHLSYRSCHIMLNNYTYILPQHLITEGQVTFPQPPIISLFKEGQVICLGHLPSLSQMFYTCSSQMFVARVRHKLLSKQQNRMNSKVVTNINSSLST